MLDTNLQHDWDPSATSCTNSSNLRRTPYVVGGGGGGANLIFLSDTGGGGGGNSNSPLRYFRSIMIEFTTAVFQDEAS